MMASLNLNRDFQRHTHGPHKGMIVIDHWYSHTPLHRYRMYFSSKAWDSMIIGAKQAAEFDMRVRASEALTPRPSRIGDEKTCE